MGLIHPRDLDAWRDWQRRSSLLQRVRAWKPSAPPQLELWLRGDAPRVLVAVDATTPSAVASVLRPFASRDPAPVDGRDAGPRPAEPLAVVALAGAPVDAALPGPWRRVAMPHGGARPDELDGVRVVVGLGAYLPAGARADAWARELGATFAVVQHGLTTPFAPPLPEGAHLLAFGEADAEFWAAGRDDVTAEPVGSQLLWDAARAPIERLADERPVFLGQLHGAELPRRDFARTSAAACLATGAVYRPHPAEHDRLSRWQHARWRRRGITVDHRGRPLAEVAAPVLAVFSTGVVEQAARGVPGWVAFDGAPPAWLPEFWERYGLRRHPLDRPLDLDSPASAPPPQPALEPALAVRAAVARLAGEARE